MTASVLRSGTAFLASRAVNAAVLLGQLALVTAWYRSSAAAAFFVVWTVGWCGAVWLRFGFDQLLPKHAARAQLTRSVAAIPGYPPLLRRTMPLLVIAVVPLLGLLLKAVTVGTLMVATAGCVVISLSWALTSVLAGLARGHGQVGLAGIVQGVVPALGALLALPVAAIIDRSWLVLVCCSAAFLAGSTVLALWLVARRVGGTPVRSLLRWQSPAFDRELVPAALVSALGETGLWLPVWLASGLGVSARDVAGLYSAARVASAFSWFAATVAAVATPQLALALARGDYVRLRGLLARSSAASALISAPIAIAGIVLAGPILGALSSAYKPYAGVLVALIAGRFVDACTGPLGEALILGGRARLELLNMIVFFLCVFGFGVALEPGLGVLGLGIATAVALAACNVPRVAATLVLLHRGWRVDAPRSAPVRRRSRRAAAPPTLALDGSRVSLALDGTRVPRHGVALGGAASLPELLGLLACVVLSTLLVTGALARGTIVGFWLALALVVASLVLTTSAARRSSGGSTAVHMRTPAAVIALVWAALFVIRPLELFLDPAATTVPLTALGFTRADLIRAVAIGALGCASWGVGYLILLGRWVPRTPAGSVRHQGSGEIALAPAFALLGSGTFLWGALFIRQGGLSVLLHHAAAIRATEGSSFYGVFGVWIVQGAGLFALDRWLRGGGRRALLVCLTAALLSVLAAVCLELRGLLVIAVLAACAIYLRERPPSRRAAVTAIAIALASVAVLGFAERVRSYTQFTTTSHAVTLALHTPLSTYALAELTPFDNLVALDELVPRSVPRLDGSSLAAIPGAFIPRALWPGKPPPLDLQLSKYLYPGVPVGSPVSMQGELWWNFGWLGVLVGALALGGLMGAVTRKGLFARTERGRLLYAVFFASAFAPMVSALATMASNTAIAVVAAATVAVGLGRPELLTSLLSGALRRLRMRVRRAADPLGRWVLGPSHGLPGQPAPTGGARFPLVDSIRGIAAVGVLVCHSAALIYVPYASPYDNWAGPLGAVAVDCFFVTSGFVLYRPFLVSRAEGAPEPSTRQFLKRRLLRVGPAYWVALTSLAIAVPVAVSGLTSGHGWIYYALVSNYAPATLPVGGLVVSWTLQVELTFYFALPAIAALLRRRSRRRGLAVGRELLAAAALLALGIGTQALVIFQAPSAFVLLRALPGYIGWFAIGMAVATLTMVEDHAGLAGRTARALGRAPLLLWAGAVAAFAGAISLGVFPTAANPSPVVTLSADFAMVMLCVLAGAMLVVPALLGASAGGLVRWLLARRALRWLGEVSFGIYLYHEPIVIAVRRSGILAAGGSLRLLELIGITFTLATACGALSWYLIERPLIGLSRRRWRVPAALSRAAAPAIGPVPALADDAVGSGA